MSTKKKKNHKKEKKQKKPKKKKDRRPHLGKEIMGDQGGFRQREEKR